MIYWKQEQKENKKTTCNQVNNEIYYTFESKSNQSLGGDDY